MPSQAIIHYEKDNTEMSFTFSSLPTSIIPKLKTRSQSDTNIAGDNMFVLVSQKYSVRMLFLLLPDEMDSIYEISSTKNAEVCFELSGTDIFKGRGSSIYGVLKIISARPPQSPSEDRWRVELEIIEN